MKDTAPSPRRWNLLVAAVFAGTALLLTSCTTYQLAEPSFQEDPSLPGGSVQTAEDVEVAVAEQAEPERVQRPQRSWLMGLAARTPREASETASVEEETEAEPTAAAENDPASSEATEMRPQRVAVRSTPSTPPAARPSPSIVESPKPEKQVAAVTEKPEPRKESPAVAKVENEKPKPEAATVAEAPAPPEPPVEAMPDNKKDTPVEAPVRTKPQPEKIAEAKPEPAPKPDKSFQNYFSLHTGPTTEGSSPQDRGTREPENPQRPRRLQVEPSESLLVENGKPGSRKSENPREGFSNYFSLFTSPESDDEEGMADASPSQD